jgi:hypothetical protein
LKQTTSYMVIKISPVFSLALVQEEGVTANFDELCLSLLRNFCGNVLCFFVLEGGFQYFGFYHLPFVKLFGDFAYNLGCCSLLANPYRWFFGASFCFIRRFIFGVIMFSPFFLMEGVSVFRSSCRLLPCGVLFSVGCGYDSSHPGR